MRKKEIRQLRQEAFAKIEPQLQVADIILSREKNWLSRAIREATGSYWSHVSIVFAIPDKHFNNTLLISAERTGIEIHRIQKYTKDFDYYDLGVKRIPGLSEKTREMVLSYVLNNVDLPYDYGRLFGLFIDYLGNRFLGKKIINPVCNENAFICSAFIQKAFYNVLPDNKKDSVVFRDRKISKFFLEEVTPADIARSKKCDWLYNPHG
ncbi:MAG: hypothetical protein HYT15_04665 [Candidatus Magasanikbacteria bacterium]|nr:hypothetical protein [Candidatus Magasanikbacteria bacterium]